MPALDVTKPPEKFAKLFEAAKPELAAFDPALRVRRQVSRGRALELSELLLTSLAPMVELFDAELSPARAAQRKSEFEGLDRRAWVFYAADLAAEEIHSNSAKKQRRQLARTVAGHDRFLMKWAMPMFGDDPNELEILRDISRGTGTRDDAEDVLRLVEMFRAHWQEIEGQQKMVTKGRLDEAAADATRQIDLLRNGVANPARELAGAAYSLWARDYGELMELGRYLARHEDDSTSRFPGIRVLPSPRARAPSRSETEAAERNLDAGSPVQNDAPK